MKRIGNSHGVIIPKPLLIQAGLSGEIEMSVENEGIVLRRSRPPVRAGWADAARSIAARWR